MLDWKSSFVKLKAVRGWLLDCYPSDLSEITVWLINEKEKRVKLVDQFFHRLYISGKTSDLNGLTRRFQDDPSVVSCHFVKKQTDFISISKRKLLEIKINDHRSASSFAGQILKFGKCGRFRVYNVDVPFSQTYLYEKDVFPLAYVFATDSGKKLHYNLLDSVENVDYDIPRLRSMQLHVKVRKKNVFQRRTDEIDRISLKFESKSQIINDGEEEDKILKLVEVVKEEDPDVIFTNGGDSFTFPYLAYRAFVNGVLNKFVLSRENLPVRAEETQGRSFFSYGRVFHKAPTRRLFGRIHIDRKNTFIYTACGMEGLIEVSRTCRVPLQKAARASIGSIMSSLQLYTAWKNNILIPWKKREPESFKSVWDLLVSDRGGFIFEPELGFHTDVVEVDFTSMFPTLMLMNNISAETVLCKCCPKSKLRVPELGYNICEKRRGIVPKTLNLLLTKRSEYKRLSRETKDERDRKVYHRRQAALKWVLVTCFGYLGYRNARFGKVDAHIAVCAFARDALLKAAKIAEKHGFKVIHGIVDSLWIKKLDASPKEVMNFCHQVSEATHVPLNVEGNYRWIVFLPSKVLDSAPVLNRYYGVFRNGKIKVRGIESRRKDTPLFISKAQTAIIEKLADASTFKIFKAQIPEALNILKNYVDKLIRGQIDTHELIVTKRLSKNSTCYAHDVHQAIAARQLKKAGLEVSPGQTVQYLIVDAKGGRVNERITVKQLLRPNSKYDVQEYLKMMMSAGETLLGVFGFNRNKIEAEVLRRTDLQHTNA